MPTEKRYCEFRFEDNTLIGTAIRYGDVASIGGFGSEKFEAGCFQPIGDVLLNLQHDRTQPLARTGGGGLELIDTETALEIRAVLNPEVASKCLALVKSKVLRGLSVEFKPVEETIENNVRVIKRAILHAIGVVDKPAYPSSTVEARAKKRRMRSKIPYATKLSCDCVGKKGDAKLSYAILDDDSFIDLDEMIKNGSKANGDDVISFYKSYEMPIGSLKNGTLKFVQTESGLEVSMDLPETNWVTDMIAVESMLLVRPIFKPSEESTVEEIDGDDVLKVKNAELKSVMVAASDMNAGWPKPEIRELQLSNFLPAQDLWLWL